jgi:hypothetical protein
MDDAAEQETDGIFVAPRGSRAITECETRGVLTLVAPGEYEIYRWQDCIKSRAELAAKSKQMSEAARMRHASTEHASSTIRASESKSALDLALNKSQVFNDFWTAYPRKIGKRTAEAAFIRACKRTSAEIVVAAAQRLADDPNLPDPQFIPHATTWLNRDGWEEPPMPSRNGKSRALAIADRLEAQGL